MDIEYGQVSDCGKCSVNNKEYEIISTGSNFWSGYYAVILIDGEIKKVPMSRLCDVKEKE